MARLVVLSTLNGKGSARAVGSAAPATAAAKLVTDRIADARHPGVRAHPGDNEIRIDLTDFTKSLFVDLEAVAHVEPSKGAIEVFEAYWKFN